MENLQKHIEEWTAENEPVGKALGYPDCCVREFCDQPPALLAKLKKPSKDDIRRYKAGCVGGVFTGFIPCAHHARLIVQGKTTLQSLIQGRDSRLPPFPKA